MEDNSFKPNKCEDPGRNRVDYVYIIQLREFIGTNIYKIGRTTQIPDRRITRFQSYPKNSEIIGVYKVADGVTAERDLLKICTQKFRLRTEYGAEYFEAPEPELVKIFLQYLLVIKSGGDKAPGSQKKSIKNPKPTTGGVSGDDIVARPQPKAVLKMKVETPVISIPPKLAKITTGIAVEFVNKSREELTTELTVIIDYMRNYLCYGNEHVFNELIIWMRNLFTGRLNKLLYIDVTTCTEHIFINFLYSCIVKKEDSACPRSTAALINAINARKTLIFIDTYYIDLIDVYSFILEDLNNYTIQNIPDNHINYIILSSHLDSIPNHRSRIDLRPLRLDLTIKDGNLLYKAIVNQNCANMFYTYIIKI